MERFFASHKIKPADLKVQTLKQSRKAQKIVGWKTGPKITACVLPRQRCQKLTKTLSTLWADTIKKENILKTLSMDYQRKGGKVKNEGLKMGNANSSISRISEGNGPIPTNQDSSV